MERAVKADPGDELAWLALADSLEESGLPGPAELHRLLVSLRRPRPDPGSADERRLRSLLASGVRPVVPTEVIRLGGGLELKLALIPPGSFWMGSPAAEPGRSPAEGPRHRVTLSRGFFLGLYPVTQAQWQRLMGARPMSYFRGDDRPAENIPWEEAQLLCRKLTNGTRRPFRLPTEAEWEYACRAGTATPFWLGPTISVKQANYNGCAFYNGGRRGTYRAHTMSVGSFAPNAFGLFDTHGNVNEWCLDAYSEKFYEESPEHDPRCYGEETSPRVCRGGAWCDEPVRCRSASRLGSHGRRTVGVRVLLESNAE